MRRSLVPVAAVAVLILTGCGSGPPQLPLNASGASTKEAAATADMAMRVANVRYELADGVKADTDKQAAYKLGEASQADAERLAKAFGITGEIRADEGGWNVGQNKSLYLSKNGSFSVNGDATVSSGVSCAEPVPPEKSAPADEPIAIEPCVTTTTTLRPNFPTQVEARSIAERALNAAGIDVDGLKPTVEQFEQVISVRYQPVFGGHPVDGYEFGVTVNADREIAYANGYVGDMKSVGTYDLATLERAVERLNTQQVYPAGDDIRTLEADAGATDPVSPDIAPVENPGGPAEQEPTVITLTAVRVGLMMTFEDNGGALWLTPAYVFSTKDNGTVLANAADDKYLPPPTTAPANDGDKPGVTEPMPIDGGSGSSDGNTGSGGGSTGSGGSVEPAPPVKE
jgi:hypothetical protein